MPRGLGARRLRTSLFGASQTLAHEGSSVAEFLRLYLKTLGFGFHTILLCRKRFLYF